MYNFLNYLILKLGYSHLCYFLMPLDIFLIRKSNKLEIKLKSFNKFILNQRLSIVQRFKIPNNYKDKGIYIS
jgi:ribosomal protein L6P/L9E